MRLLSGFALIALILAAVPIGGRQDAAHTIVRELAVLAFFFLVHWRAVGAINFVSGLLGGKFFHWLGELSYGVYLVHLLIMQPVAAWAIGQFGARIGDFAGFSLVLGIVVPAAYLISFVTYRAIEVPGQKLGKSILRRSIRSPATPTQTPAEKLASP